jgi:hypothetical protein
MCTARRINHLAVLCALACTLLVSATNAAAASRPNEQPPVSPALAQERYYSSYGEPKPIHSGTSAALAQERHYSSYGEPQPMTQPQSPPPTDDTPWLPIVLSIAAALAIVAASATQLRRLRVRRRRGARVSV